MVPKMCRKDRIVFAGAYLTAWSDRAEAQVEEQTKHMPKNRKKTASAGDREVLGLFVAFISFAVGYFLAEALLARFIHPVHWMAAAVVALLGYVVTVLVYSRLPKSRKP